MKTRVKSGLFVLVLIFIMISVVFVKATEDTTISIIHRERIETSEDEEILRTELQTEKSINIKIYRIEREEKNLIYNSDYSGDINLDVEPGLYEVEIKSNNQFPKLRTLDSSIMIL